MIKDIKESIESADYIVVCFGKEIYSREISDFNKCVDKMNDLLKEKNYFYLSTDPDAQIRTFNINSKRVSCPLNQNNQDEEEKQWDFYNKWLASSLAKSLVIIEFGEDFSNPNVVRWPFERITMINQKSKLYRINKTFYQIPPEIKDRSVTIDMDAFEFIMNL